GHRRRRGARCYPAAPNRRADAHVVASRPTPGGRDRATLFMIEADVYHALLMLMFALAGAAFVGTGLVVAPYGRHERGGFGPSLPERLGWLLMESPAALVFVFVFTRGPRSGDLVPLFFLSLWLGHYLYRAFIYPLRMRSRPGRRMPLLVVAL